MGRSLALKPDLVKKSSNVAAALPTPEPSDARMFFRARPMDVTHIYSASTDNRDEKSGASSGNSGERWFRSPPEPIH